jgi:ribosomal protein S18 acetylase RimI-like enzyme
MQFQVEKLKQEEIPQFFEVFRQVMWDGYNYPPKIKEHFLNKIYSRENFHYWLDQGYKSILVSKKLDLLKICGFLVYDQPYGGVLLARWLGVLKEYRKKGLGRQLINFFIKEAKTLGCHKIELAVQQNARDFYLKCGLKEEGFRKKSYFGQNQYIFGKVIGELDEERVIKS